MRSYFYNIFFFSFTIFSLLSCEQTDENGKDTNINEQENLSTKNSEPTIDIDKDALKKVSKEIPNFKPDIDETPASVKDINLMVSEKNESKLNEYQKAVQEFFKASAKKDYTQASKYLAYRGRDKKRNKKDHFNINKPNEYNIVKSTVDVIYGFLEESKDYEFISFKKQAKAKESIYIVELTFFKKGIGYNRRFFELIDSPNGKIIYNMK